MILFLSLEKTFQYAYHGAFRSSKIMKSKATQKTKWLETKRKKIDKVTERLVHLLLERRELSQNIMRLKKQNGLPKLDAGREREILKKYTQGLNSSETRYVSAVLKQILKSTKAR